MLNDQFSLDFDPFSLFNLNYCFDIVDLDSIYYRFFKISSDKSLINRAYSFLLDPALRIHFLCNYYNCQEKIDLNEVIFIKKMNVSDQKNIKKVYLNKAILAAKLNSWQEASFFINFYFYL